MDINFELYKVFYLVASTLSFSEASKRLFLSQSAVSQSIKALERELGQPLFFRNTKKVRLSPAGELLLRYVEPAVHLISRGEAQLADSGGLALGQLHIAASDTICRYFLLPYFKQFRQLFPDVPIKVTNATSVGCVSLLSKGKVDLIVTNYPNPGLEDASIKKRVATFSDVFIANPAYFGDGGRALTLEEIGKFPILMLEQESTTREFLRGLFLRRQIELVPEAELSSNDLLIDFARIGLGVAFIPDYCLSADDGTLRILETAEEIPPRALVAAADRALRMPAAAEEFLKLLPGAP